MLAREASPRRHNGLANRMCEFLALGAYEIVILKGPFGLAEDKLRD